MYPTKTFRSRMLTMVMCVFLAVILDLSAAAAYPKHENFISDPDSILSDTTVDAIISTNKTLAKSREVQIAVCIVTDTGDESIADFSRTLFTEWDMSDGILLVLKTGSMAETGTDPTYFSVQSVNIDDVVTNLVLSSIMNENLEEDFLAGSIDRGVMKTVTAFAQYMTANLPDPNAETTETAEEPEEDSEPSGFVKFMKAILWLLLILVVLAVAVFILALYNDDVGDFVRTYVFRRGTPQQTNYANYYDDRLYGSQNPPERNPRNPYNPYGQNGQYSRQGEQYSRPRNGGQYRQTQNGQNRNPYDPYNDYEMQYQQPRSGQYPNQGYSRQGTRSGQPQQGQPQGQYPRRPQGQYPAQGQYPDPRRQQNTPRRNNTRNT